MGTIFSSSVNEMFLNALKADNVEYFKSIYTDNNIMPDQYILKSGRNLVHLCSCYGSTKCLKFLILEGNNINIKDKQDGSTPLILASKFDEIEIIKILLNNNCDIHITQDNNLNALDMSILRGNYNIAFYLKKNCNFRPIKTLNEYHDLHLNMEFPLFDLDLFYEQLLLQTQPEDIKRYNKCRNVKREFEGKVPDPNETWGHFLKRIVKLELYQPPLVDENEVDNEMKMSFYMRVQTKLCEMEYGVKSKFYIFYIKNIVNKRKMKKENETDIEKGNVNLNK